MISKKATSSPFYQ